MSPWPTRTRIRSAHPTNATGFPAKNLADPLKTTTCVWLALKSCASREAAEHTKKTYTRICYPEQGWDVF